MPTKPRPLGNKARDFVADADTELTAAAVVLEKLDNDEQPLLARLVALNVAKRIANARRLLAELKALRD